MKELSDSLVVVDKSNHTRLAAGGEIAGEKGIDD